MTRLSFYTDQYASNGQNMPYAIAAGGVVYRQHNGGYEFLLLGRNQDGVVTYHLPKGTVHVDETLESAAVREIAEEAGVSVVLKTYLGATTNQYTYNCKEFDKTVHIYAAEYTGEVGDMDNEHDVRDWYGFEEAIFKLSQERKNEGQFLIRCKKFLDGETR